MPITKAKSRGNFVQLGNYLAQEKEDDDLEWGCSENLEWIQDYENVSKVMTATASRSPNASRIKPVYHLVISYDPADRDKLTKEQKDEIAHRAADALGFGGGYQYKFVHHNDKNHEHTHFVGNKVHPETLKSLKLSHDYKKLRQFSKQIEKEYGLTPTIEKQQKWEVSEEDEAFFKQIDRPVKRALDTSGSWAELKQELAIHKLDIKKRGRGAVIYDLQDEKKKIKLSHFGRQHSYGKLSSKYGEGLEIFEDRQQWKEQNTFEAKYEWFKLAKGYMGDGERLVESTWLKEELSEASQAQRDREERFGEYRSLNSPEYIEGEKLKSKEYLDGDKIINDYQATKDDLGKYNDAQAAENALRDLNMDSQQSADNIKKRKLETQENKRTKIKLSRGR